MIELPVKVVDCAVCHAVDQLILTFEATGFGALYRVVCPGCGYSAPPNKTEEKAVARWNSCQSSRGRVKRNKEK